MTQTQVEPDEAESLFPGAPFGPLAMGQCLFYYDGPQLYLGLDAAGNSWLCLAIDDDREARRSVTMAMALSTAEAHAWGGQHAGTDFIEPLRAALRGERVRWTVVVSWNDGRVVDCHPASADEIAYAMPRD